MSSDSSSSGNTWYQTYFDGPNTLTHQEPHHTPYHPKRERPFTARRSCPLTPSKGFVQAVCDLCPFYSLIVARRAPLFNAE